MSKKLEKILVGTNQVAEWYPFDAETTKIKIGEITHLSAKGYDAEENQVEIYPKWTASNPGMVEIMPKVGPHVEVKGLKKGTIDIVVEYAGVKTILKLVSIE